MAYDKIDEDAISLALSDMNPWWRTGTAAERQPGTKRHAWSELETWLLEPPAHKAINVTGPRYVGKTTLLLQMVERLLDDGFPASRILFAAFDDYRLSGARLDQVIRHWQGRYGDQPGVKYLFLDELQRADHWDRMTKKMVDDHKDRKIFFTGSAICIGNKQKETGPGRWFDVNVGTLSFGEYLAFSNSAQRDLSGFEFGTGLDGRTAAEFSMIATVLEEPFNRYLLQGGFPETALMNDLPRNRRLVIDQLNKVLPRGLEEHVDGYGTLEFAATHRYLTQRDREILNVKAMANDMWMHARKASRMVDVLVEANLVRELPGLSLGSLAMRGRRKTYVVDNTVVATYKNLAPGDVSSEAAGELVESAVFHHLWNNALEARVWLSYWRDRRGNEVDFVAMLPGYEYVPVDVRYRKRTQGRQALRELERMHADKKFSRGYVVTKEPMDIGEVELFPGMKDGPKILKIPAPVFCLLQSKPGTSRMKLPWI